MDRSGKVIWVYEIPFSGGTTFAQFTSTIVDNGSMRFNRYPENYFGFNGLTMVSSGIIEDVNSILPINQIKVFDIYEKLVLSRVDFELVNMENLANGLYILEISSGQNTESLK